MSLEIIIILIYMVSVIGVGIYSQMKVSSSENGINDYYAAGSNVGTIFNALAMMTALGSGGTFMALSGTVWTFGYSYFAWMFSGAVTGFFVASILVAKALRRSGKVTVPSYLEFRYNSKPLMVLATVVVILGSSMYLISQMAAGGMITEYVTGFSYEISLIIVGFVFILYVSIGGMMAVTWTNIIQGALIILIGVFILFGGIMYLPTNYKDFFNQALIDNPSMGTIDPQTIFASIGAFITWAAAASVTPHLIMRVFTAKNEKSAKLSMNIAMLLYSVLIIIPAFIVVPYINTLGAEILENYRSDMWLLLVVEELFSPLVIGLILAGLLAAVMSSTDSLLLAVSSAVSYDIYYRVFNNSASQKKIIVVSTIATWLIGIIVVIITLNPPEFIIVFYTGAVGFMVSSLFAPLVLGVWWKKASGFSAMVGLISGALVFWIFYLGFSMPSNSEVLIALPVSIIAMIIATIMRPSPVDVI